MTFTEQIYDQINSLSPLSTDDFSIHWLGQSRSYYSSNKARGLEASNSALVKLMNKLLEQRDVLMTKNYTSIPCLISSESMRRLRTELVKKLLIDLSNQISLMRMYERYFTASWLR